MNASTTPSDTPKPAGSTALKAAQKESVKKWGKSVASRFTLVPALLFEYQHELKLKPAAMNLLLQIMSFWWRASDLPWPSKRKLAERLQLDPTSVRRHLKKLEKDGFLQRVTRKDDTQGQQSNFYSLAPLRKKLEEFARKDALRKQEKRKKAGRK